MKGETEIRTFRVALLFCAGKSLKNRWFRELLFEFFGCVGVLDCHPKSDLIARLNLLLTKVSASLPIAVDMAALAALLDGQKIYAESEGLYRLALRTYRREYGTNRSEFAVLLGNLAAHYQATGRMKTSLQYHRLALKIKRQKLGTAHPSVATTLNNLGMMHFTQGNTYQAKRCIAAALQILLHSFGRRHFQYRIIKGNYDDILRGPTSP